MYQFHGYLNAYFVFFHVHWNIIVYIVREWEGETLDLTRISRLDMGAYMCIASNGVPPAVSKRIKVSVDCKFFFSFLFSPSNGIFFYSQLCYNSFTQAANVPKF